MASTPYTKPAREHCASYPQPILVIWCHACDFLARYQPTHRWPPVRHCPDCAHDRECDQCQYAYYIPCRSCWACGNDEVVSQRLKPGAKFLESRKETLKCSKCNYVLDGSSPVMKHWRYISTSFDGLPDGRWPWAWVNMEKVEEWWKYLDQVKIEEKNFRMSGIRIRACLGAIEWIQVEEDDDTNFLEQNPLAEMSLQEQQQMLEMTKLMNGRLP